METKKVKKQQAQIWISVPENHKWTIVSLSAAGIIILVVIFFWAGYLLCVAAAVAMLLTAIFAHFKLQRRIVLSKLVYYYDREELFLISLHKTDQKLYAFLHGNLPEEERPSPTENPADYLLALTDRSSVIWHITNITQIVEKKARLDDKRYEINMIFDLLSYTYKSVLCYQIHSKHFENFESLMQVLQDIHAKTKL